MGMVNFEIQKFLKNITNYQNYEHFVGSIIR